MHKLGINFHWQLEVLDSMPATSSFPFHHSCPSQVACLDQMATGQASVHALQCQGNCSYQKLQHGAFSSTSSHSIESRRWAQLCQTPWVRSEKNRAPKLIFPLIAGETLALVPAPDPQGQMNVFSEKQDKLVLYDQQALFMEAFSSEAKWTIPIAYCKNKCRER